MRNFTSADVAFALTSWLYSQRNAVRLSSQWHSYLITTKQDYLPFMRISWLHNWVWSTGNNTDAVHYSAILPNGCPYSLRSLPPVSDTGRQCFGLPKIWNKVTQVSGHGKQRGITSILYRIWGNTSFFLGQYVTYCSLILGSATLGQYLDIKPSSSETARNSKINYVLSPIR